MLSTTFFASGEFGQVYKGYVKTRYTTDIVAVKTLKGEEAFKNATT